MAWGMSECMSGWTGEWVGEQVRKSGGCISECLGGWVGGWVGSKCVNFGGVTLNA
jgi:uncharacterized membrane protein YeaQ/YmgE (transglycosylase-associated protein family)